MLITLPNVAALFKQTLWLISRLRELLSVSCEQLTFFRLESTFQCIRKMFNDGKRGAEIKMAPGRTAQGHILIREEAHNTDSPGWN